MQIIGEKTYNYDIIKHAIKISSYNLVTKKWVMNNERWKTVVIGGGGWTDFPAVMPVKKEDWKKSSSAPKARPSKQKPFFGIDQKYLELA